MLSEADTCRTYVTPRLRAAGWSDDQITEQRTFTYGRIFVTNGLAKRGKPKRADYLLYYQPCYPVAVVEAKAMYKSPVDGVQQAKDYAITLGLLFAYATNGQGIIEIDLSAGTERTVDAFPSPTDLWTRYRAVKGLPEELENRLLIANQISGSHPPRYYQQIAINRAVEAVLQGKRRVLLMLATGTGKVATIEEIKGQDWSLNPGRYVGVAEREADAFDFRERLGELSEEFARLTTEAHDLEERINANVAALLEAE